MLRMIRMIILMLRMIILMGQDDGSWFMAHGSRLMAHGSWLMAKGGRPGPGARGSARSGRVRARRSPGLQGRAGPPWP